MDIFQFAYHAMPENCSLYPMQNAILKAFYRETPWNEQLDNYGSSSDVELPDGSFIPSEHPRELVWITGRRTGKDCITSILVWYEFFKLATQSIAPEPELAHGNTVVMVIVPTIAQGRILWQEILGKLNRLKNTVDASDRYGILKAANTLELSNTRMAAKIFTAWGSVELVVRSGNSESIIGHSVHSLICNDLACLPNPERVLAMLVPTLATYRNGKLFVITSPRGLTPFWESLTSGKERRMVVTTPTWVANPCHTERTLRESEPQMSEEQFAMEYGAAFSIGEETEQVTLRLRQTTIERLKKVARKRAYELDKDVTYTDVIRELVEAVKE